MNITDTALNSLLKGYFNQDEFYPDQKEIISSILSGKNVLVMKGNMPEPSLCYRLPAVLLENITLVISHKKRVSDINNILQLPEVFIHNYITENNFRRVLQNIKGKKYKIVYISPEQLQNRIFLYTITRIPISLIAIESAQCASPYSYDFRPEYIDISRFIKEIDFQQNILAMSDACTSNIRNDIISQLKLDDPDIFISDLSLTDTSLEVIKAFSQEEKYSILESIINRIDGQLVIYTNYVNKTIEIYEFISKLNSRTAFYHSGLLRDKREEIEKEFNSGRIKIIVATNCFHIEPENKNISHIIHFDMPDGLERYYEQVSISGRTKCILLYCPSDRQFHHSMIEKEGTSLSDIWRITDFLRKSSKKIRQNPSNLVLVDQKKENQTLSLEKWLDDHFRSLTPEVQIKLKDLKSRCESASDVDKNPYTPKEYDQYLESDHWKNFRKEILSKNELCQICENKAKQVHHLHYRTLGKEEPDDVIALCDKCHCFIHPESKMTYDIFTEVTNNERRQLKLPDIKYPETIISYEQLEIETNLNKYKIRKALRLMEIAGMLIVKPDSSINARVTFQLSKEGLLSLKGDLLDQSIINQLIKYYDYNEIEINLNELQGVLSCSYEELENRLISLDHSGSIKYIPKNRGTTLQLIDLEVLLTDDIFESLKKVRYDAIKKVEEYANTQECRQKFMNEYFSDDIYDKCQKCDNCRNISVVKNEETSSMPYDARVILELVNFSDGSLSKRKLAGILAGQEQRTIKFEKWEEFGTLSMLKLEEIISIIDILIGYGLLEEKDEQVKITERGFNSLKDSDLMLSWSLMSHIAEDIRRIPNSRKPKLTSMDAVISKGEQKEHLELSEHDKAQIAILKCAGKTDGQIDRGDMLKILKGQKTKRIAKFDFDHIEEYGLLRELSRETVLKYIDELIESGCLKVVNVFFPKIQITDVGRRRLSKMSKN